mgnify:CR=1 FL=1
MRIEDTTILITDDSILARKQLKDIISTLGTPVFVEATDGQSAIDKYKEVHPDLVFLDIVMPKKKTAMMPSVILWNLIRKLQSSSLLLSEHSPS